MSFIKKILNNDWNSLNEDVSGIIAEKLQKRIQNKTVEVLAKINGVSLQEQATIMGVVLKESTEEAKEDIDDLKKEKDDVNEAADEVKEDFIFPADSKKVTDKKGHYPIGNAAHGRNALARANQMDKAPTWFEGSLEEFVKDVVDAFNNKSLYFSNLILNSLIL